MILVRPTSMAYFMANQKKLSSEGVVKIRQDKSLLFDSKDVSFSFLDKIITGRYKFASFPKLLVKLA